MNKQPLRVLLVEDDADDFLLTRDLLNEITTFDCETEWAATYAAAKEAIAEKTFDVCLIDYRLGEHTGLELLREAVADGFRAPMILLTGQDDRAIDLEAMQAGAADYLIKGKMEAVLLERTIRYALERRRAEEALEKAAKRERAMIGNALDVICTIDAEGRFSTINPACFKMWGYQPEELVGFRYIDLVAPEDVARTNEKAASVMRGEELTDFENRCRHKNGTLVNIIWAVHWSKSEQLMYAVAHDITERKRVEEALRENEAKFRDLFDNAPIAYHELDMEGRFTRINHTEELLLGYTNEELKGRYPWEIIVEKQSRDAVKAKLAGERQLVPVERTFIRKDGTLISVLNEDRAIYDTDGKLVGIRSTLQDISELKRAEKVLQESELRYRRLFENNPNPIWVYDTETLEFLAVNEEATRHYGYSREEFQKLTIKEMRPPEELPALLKYIEQANAGVEKFYSVKHQKKDGTQIEVDIAAQSIIFGGRSARLSLITDVTEQKRADAALRESEYKLRTLIGSMNEGLLQVDAEDRINFVNHCFCEMVGYSEDELIGLDWCSLLFEDEGCDLVRQVNERRRRGISDRYELRLRKKSGEELWVIVGGVPMLDKDGEIDGSMGVFTDITTRKRAEEQLLHDAFHDQLSGLANRALFMDHLRLTIERGKSRRSNSYAVLFLDFDRFKVVNDSLGHTEGDNLLKFIARRLESATRTGDLVARLGGDEFVILLSELVEEGDAVRIAERIQNSLKKPFELNGSEVFITASIGIAPSAAGHKNAEDMLRDADIAMYRAKAKGKARYEIFDQAMHEHASRQLSMETEMRRALEQKQFQIHYQPIMNLETEALVGFEALVRWKHPERGMIAPFDFIPAAEENGLILPLGAWILHESCRQMRLWQKENPALSNLTVSVNLSCKQFSQFDLAEQIAATLAATKIDPHCLKLEITESHIMENSETAITTLNSLRALGVELSLDDFGTGYSSLSYLHRLPVSYLKIDRSFVSRMIENKENSEIVHTIIKLAQNLKMKVVAEGIETGEQLAHLKNLNCEYGQGYFFAKPLEAEAARKFIGANSAKNLTYAVEQPVVGAEFNM